MAKKATAAKPQIPKTHQKSDTTYKVVAETYYYPKPKNDRAAPPKAYKPKPMKVEVVNPVRLKGARKK